MRSDQQMCVGITTRSSTVSDCKFYDPLSVGGEPVNRHAMTGVAVCGRDTFTQIFRYLSDYLVTSSRQIAPAHPVGQRLVLTEQV